MEEGLLNVCIASAVVRVCCKVIDVDQAIKESLRRNNCETIPAAEYTELRADVESTLAGKWPHKERQIELTL